MLIELNFYVIWFGFNFYV